MKTLLSNNDDNPWDGFLATERAFHDNYAKRLNWSHPVSGMLSYEFDYEDKAEEYFRGLLGDVRDKVILDIGSGHGSCALGLAKRSAHVTSIDISPELIEGCRKRASANGLAAEFEVMNACALGFADASFDMVVAARTVHHLPDVAEFYREAHRVLKLGGVLLLLEPQKYNPFVEIGRKFIRSGPEWRTSTEHPLVPKDLRMIKTVFGNFETKEFEFLTSACLIFKMLGMNWLHRASTRLMRPLDNVIRLVPIFRPLYWQVVVMVRRL
ncbi:MAG: class I SAM-dependent methyltransferase [Candidatus Acidiferrum sp.]